MHATKVRFGSLERQSEPSILIKTQPPAHPPTRSLILPSTHARTSARGRREASCARDDILATSSSISAAGIHREIRVRWEGEPSFCSMKRSWAYTGGYFILPTVSKICPRHNPTTTCKGTDHGITPKWNIYTKIYIKKIFCKISKDWVKNSLNTYYTEKHLKSNFYIILLYEYKFIRLK